MLSQIEAGSLINRLISENYTLISHERFNMIYRHAETISKLEGDIVECGVWKGGMSIFLSQLFDAKQMWAVDSFAGFQNHLTAKYYYQNEGHTEGGLAVSLEDVINNFKTFDALNNRVHFLKGYVVDTLHPNVCPIYKIALLRIDVDAYSATMEVLETLFDKVVSGGYVIFDDSCLSQTADAMRDYFIKNNIPLQLYKPTDDSIARLEDYECGYYFIKQ